MEKRLTDFIRNGIKENLTLDEIRHSLINQGYLEKDINDSFNELSKELRLTENKKKKNLSNIFFTKETLDRIGYGFGSEQFINILFFHTGASYFLIGLINGIKALFSVLLSSFLTKYTETTEINIRSISRFGIVFGFSFLFIGIARFLKSIPLFIFAIFLSTLSVVSHGDLYQKLLSETIKKENRSELLKKIGQYGVFILALSMLLSAYLMNIFPETGKIITIFGYNFRIYGYLISFEITAFAFIISGFITSFIKEKPKTKISISEEFQNFYYTLKYNTIRYLKNKTTFVLILCSTITGFAQILGYSYYGIYMYQIFEKVYLGGFLNVAIVFLIGILLSILSPKIARTLSLRYGNVPMLVFGTLLLSIMPFTFYFNPSIFSIAAGTAISVIGSSLVGLGTALSISNLINKKDRKIYYAIFSLIVTIPYLISIPVGAWFTEIYGARILFFYLGIILSLIVTPLYVSLLFIKREAIL